MFSELCIIFYIKSSSVKSLLSLFLVKNRRIRNKVKSKFFKGKTFIRKNVYNGYSPLVFGVVHNV